MLTRQEKVVIVASRERQRDVIETLYRLRAAHLIEFHEGHDPHGMRFGRPLPEGSRSSERLVRLRALVRNLGLEGRPASKRTAAAEIERRIDAALTSLEVDVAATVEARDRVRHELKELDDREAKLQPLVGLPLRVEDYSGYRSLRVLVGRTAEPVTVEEIARAASDAITFAAADLVAVFAPLPQADAAQEVLLRKGFREVEPPQGQGAVPELLAEAGRERARLAERLEKSQTELARLATEHGDFLVAAEEHLSIEVEKAEAPLSFGSTDYAFVVQAWVPSGDVPRLQAALQERVGDAFHIERAAPAVHGHGDAHHSNEPHDETAPDGADSQTVPAETKERHAGADTPPTQFRNPRWARPFQYFTTMFSTPRYGEIDPTAVLSVAFPVFFGFMISDLGYGTIMAVLGLWMALRLGKIEGMRELGTVIAVAGIIAMALGGLVFHDAFGIPFFAHEGVPASELAEHPEFAGLSACQQFAGIHTEATWSCLLTGNLVVHAPLISKLTDASTLLIMSILAAIVHLSLGLVFGIVNEMRHSWKHTVAKVGWLLLLVGFTYQILAIARHNAFLGGPLWYAGGGTASTAAGACGYGSTEGALGLCRVAFGSVAVLGQDLTVLFLVLAGAGLALLFLTEGAIAALEIPSLLANILSYTRLGGVAVAKAAMAAAFNGLFLVGMVLHPGEPTNVLLVIVGALLVLLTQSIVLVLGLLSSGIQAIRLNYVEFFTKFFKGGGTPFRAFGRERSFSLESASTIP